MMTRKNMLMLLVMPVLLLGLSSSFVRANDAPENIGETATFQLKNSTTQSFAIYPIHDEYVLPEVPDRLQWLNRKTFAFNSFFEKFLLRPIARGYIFITPKFFRTAIGNLSRTLGRPLSAVNALLQFDIPGFFNNVFAFTSNVFFGVFGLVDFYEQVSAEEVWREDFSQTMGVYGVGYGSYLVLPFLGPYSLRGLIGLITDTAIDPVRLYAVDQGESQGYLGFSLIRLLNNYAQNLDLIVTIYKTSLDPYSALRSFYHQSQIKQVYNGDPPPVRQPDNLQENADDEEDFLDDL